MCASFNVSLLPKRRVSTTWACRWPDGFRCPRCEHERAYTMVKQRRWKCVACRHQVSLTAGTILHNTKTPLTLWFWAAYLMTTDKRGISALLLQRQLGLRRYETAWMILHKLRRATVNFARELLRGEVESDDTWVGGTQAGLRRGSSAQGAPGGTGSGGGREAGPSLGTPSHGRHPGLQDDDRPPKTRRVRRRRTFRSA